MTAQEKLRKRINEGFHICVGLDSDISKLPKHLLYKENPILEFNKIIIEATYKEAVAFKINFAFYENRGIEGLETLEKTIEFIGEEVLIIADAKRGDIGNTSKKYAESVFDYFKCDAVTLHPYMGFDSIEPFISYKDKISFILGLTSNSSSSDFEKQMLQNGKYLFQEVISKTNEWNKNKNCGLVFGATNSEELQMNISSFDDLPILLPGVGAQGGSLEDVVNIFKIHNKENYLINVSRGLIYVNDGIDFKESVKEKLSSLNEQIYNILI